MQNHQDSELQQSGDPLLSPPFQNQFDAIDFTSFTSSMSQLITPAPLPADCSLGDVATNSMATEDRLYQASVVLEYRQLYNRYTACLASLQKSIKEVDALLQENDNLRLINTNLVKRFTVLSQATAQNCLLTSCPPPLFINDFNRLSIGSTVRDSHVAEEVSAISPTSIIGHDVLETRDLERVSLPKSISVRGGGYQELNRHGESNGDPSRLPSSNRVTNSFPDGSQRVHVSGRKREEAAPLELEVYNQGMLKTELCNKWQQTGICPYGDRCQFAHGINELRPVIRHPRYKTDPCRMVLAGDTCPYGHRCHFRHSITDEEKLPGPL